MPFGEGNGNPLWCSCLENPRDGGAWWAAVYGVTQSWTRLKWLSSSSNYAILYKEPKYPQSLVSEGALEAFPYRYWARRYITCIDTHSLLPDLFESRLKTDVKSPPTSPVYISKNRNIHLHNQHKTLHTRKLIFLYYWATWEDPLEKETATHSSILAWKIPWTEEPLRLQSMGSQRVGHDWVTSLSLI